MSSDNAPSDLYTLRHIAHAIIDWPDLYRRALPAGCGHVLAADDERIAAVDELLALTLRELTMLGELSAFASVEPLADDARRPLAQACAALLRLLDGALAAHGRDNGYRVDAWRKQTATTAWAIAAALGEHDDDTWPLPAAIDRTANRIAGELLVIYAAASEV